MAGILSKDIALSYCEDPEATSPTWTKLTNLREIPALGAVPEKVDVTCLEHGERHYIQGIKDYGDLEFRFIYDPDQYDDLDALVGQIAWKVELPNETHTGVGTTCTFTGEPAVAVDGVGVNEAIEYTLSIALSSEIEFA